MADALVDAHDSLRTIALQARDVGSLSLALVAAHSDFSELWLALGRLARPRRQQSATSVSGAVDAVRRAAKKNSDTLRRKLICLTTAKKHFRLSDRELSSLRYHAAKKKHYARAPPMRLYSELEVQELACASTGTATGRRQRSALRASATPRHSSRTRPTWRRKRRGASRRAALWPVRACRPGATSTTRDWQTLFCVAVATWQQR